MSINLFITGTDTDAGKTYVSIGLLNAFKQQGLSTLGIKPVSAGCHDINGKLYNDDALLLQQASTIQMDYEFINPFAFKEAVAPHLAAKKMNAPTLTASHIIHQLQIPLSHPCDVKIIEGAGGWHVPINDKETMADVVKAQSFAVILVVGMRLGCLNHAILTSRAIAQSGVKLLGWIANGIDPEMKYLDENIETLRTWINAPMLDRIGYQQTVSKNIATTIASLSSLRAKQSSF